VYLVDAITPEPVLVIPTDNNGMLTTKKFYGHNIKPQHTQPLASLIPMYPCVEVEWPLLVEKENDYKGKYELELKKRKVIRIYCKHNAKYNDYKVRPSDSEKGTGLLSAPYVAIGDAIKEAMCIVRNTCSYVQVFVLQGSDKVFILNYGSDTFESAKNRLMIGSTDGETYFELSDDQESPNGQHIADAIACQCTYNGTLTPCPNGNITYFDAKFTGTKTLSPHYTASYEQLHCRNLINATIKNINVSCAQVYGCDIAYDVFKYSVYDQAHEYTQDHIKGGKVYVSGINSSKLTNIEAITCSYLHNTELSGMFEEIRTTDGSDAYRPVTIKRIPFMLDADIVSDSNINNGAVSCNVLIDSTVTSIGSTDSYNILAIVKEICSGSSITFSTSAFIYSTNGSVDDYAIALAVNQECVVSDTKASCTLSSNGKGGAGWLISCDIERGSKCVQGCKISSYGGPYGGPAYRGCQP
jgi:hypothetical protein